MIRKKVYIAGPMSGLPDCNRHAFNLAAQVQKLTKAKSATQPNKITLYTLDVRKPYYENNVSGNCSADGLT
jgi:hypothetical protein